MFNNGFISFETAKRLKDAGFPQYKKEDGFFGIKYNREGELTTAPYAEHYAATSVSMANEWLRTEHNLFCVCVPYAYEDGIGFAYKIYFLDSIHKGCYVKGQGSCFSDPAEALDAAIKYCADNLL